MVARVPGAAEVLATPVKANGDEKENQSDQNSGWGRLFLDRERHAADIKLWRKAIRQRWNISEEFQTVALARLEKIIGNGQDDEIALKAIAELRHLMAQNQKDEHKVIDVHVQARNDELLEIASELGIEVSVIEHASRQADSGSGST